MGLLDHESRIAELTKSASGIDPPTDSYLARALASPVTTGFFCDHATGLAWLPWLENQPAFQNLFDATFQDGEIELRLARWFADEIAVKSPIAGLSLVHRRGGHLSPLLSKTIAYAMSGQEPPYSDVIRRWVSMLLDTHPGWSDPVLSYILTACVWPEDETLALRLFDHLTTPVLSLRPGFGFAMSDEPGEYPEVLIETALLGEEYLLREAWEQGFIPHLEECATELSVIVTRNLMACWQQQDMAQPGGSSLDRLSDYRSAIEPHEQDAISVEINVLIDAARDVLEHLLARDDGSGAAILQHWSSLPGDLFRRLVIHGWSQRPDKSSDEKLRWLLENERLVEGGPGST